MIYCIFNQWYHGDIKIKAGSDIMQLIPLKSGLTRRLNVSNIVYVVLEIQAW